MSYVQNPVSVNQRIPAETESRKLYLIQRPKNLSYIND